MLSVTLSSPGFTYMSQKENWCSPTRLPQTADSTPPTPAHMHTCSYSDAEASLSTLGHVSSLPSQHCWIPVEPSLLTIFFGGPRALSTQSANNVPGEMRACSVGRGIENPLYHAHTQLEVDRGRKEPGSTESERVIKTVRRRKIS